MRCAPCRTVNRQALTVSPLNYFLGATGSISVSYDFIFLIEKGRFSRDVNTALISLLLKKDKDPTECSSYRPLSLLNSDLKVFAKLLARRLKSHMPSLVSSDQTGFIKSRLATDNVRRLLHTRLIIALLYRCFHLTP